MNKKMLEALRGYIDSFSFRESLEWLSKEQVDYIIHAVNSHDSLVAENKKLKKGFATGQF